MGTIKNEIEDKLNNMELVEAINLIKLYEKEIPMDMDLLSYRCIYHMSNNELDKALEYALIGVKRYPTSGDMYYNLAFIYELKNKVILACKNYVKALYIYSIEKDEKQVSLRIKDKIEELVELTVKEIKTASQEDSVDYIEEVKVFQEQFKRHFCLTDFSYRNFEQIVGDYYWITEDEKRYIGIYRLQYSDFIGRNNWDLIHTKAEFLKASEGTYQQIKATSEKVLLPIAVEEKNTIHLFKKNGKEIASVLQREYKHFNYYKVESDTEVYSSGKSFYGKPIALGHSSSRKKIVLNMFIDGLPQEVISGDDFASLMPNTYKFFKKGQVCNQVYCAAEWTYPSIANIVTGLDTRNHMMFHDTIDIQLPKDVPTLSEYFQKEGYFTSTICGDWRVTPAYGYARGCDQFIYQNSITGMREEMVIGDVLDHLEAFQDTDQFLWIAISDLHDVADGLDLPLAVQNSLELIDRKIEEKGSTSVKQSYSENKIKALKKSISHIDILLNSLYTYLEGKYSNDEIIVSLFADHGQGYLVPEGGHFLSKERSKVAFMFRGGHISEGMNNEIISTCDYLSIMCKLAGISMQNIEITGNLPVCFGGKKEREYAMTESIYPNDPYYATLFTKQHIIYFENGVPTGHDGRFELKEYKITATDLNGTIVNDKELLNKYLNIIMEHIAPLRKYK